MQDMNFFPTTMKTHFLWLALLAFAVQKSTGNSGTSFIMSFANNKYSTSTSFIDIYLSTAVEHNVMVNVTAPKFHDFDIDFSISLTSGTPYHLTIDDRFRMPAGITISPRTLVIKASDPVNIVGVNIHKSNGDAFVAIPDMYLGKEYIAVTYIPGNSISAAFITVSAGSGSYVTSVSVTFPSWSGNEEVFLNGTLYRAGEVAEMQLLSLETLQIETIYDLTGTLIKTDHPVAVYSGVNRTVVYNSYCLSHLLDQMPPLDRVGRNYVSIPFPERDIGDVYRIVATEVETVVTIPDNTDISLSKIGDFHEVIIPKSTFYYLNASKPVIVAQISASRTGKSSKYGDPSLMILTPTEGAYFNVTFSRASYPIAYVTIVTLAQDKDGVMFDHDPLATNQQWFPVVGNANYAATQIFVGSSDKQHTIYHNGGSTFVAYFHTGTTCEAQAMSLGLSLDVINNPCRVSPSVPGDGVDNDCDGQIDEEACCVNRDIADNDGDGRFNEDCAGYSGNDSTGYVCCDSRGTPYSCKPISRSVLFGQLEAKARVFASSVTKTSIYTQTACIMYCVQQDDCWGTNFKPTQLAPGNGLANCEILTGDKRETIEDDLWHFRGVSKRTMLYS